MNESSRIRIVLANSSLVGYPEAGGLWMLFLQHLLGLHALGNDVFWLEVFHSSGDLSRDQRLIDIFFKRMGDYGLDERCILLFNPKKTWSQTLDGATTFGRTQNELKEIVRSADLLWNFAYALHPPLLLEFKRRVFLDGDPGLLQVSAQNWNMGQNDHHLFFTVGSKINDADCRVPKLDLAWHFFPPLVCLPLWKELPDPGPVAAFSTVTQWNWKEIWDDPALSISKRSAYLKYVDLPRATGRPFELAANIHPEDNTGDREMLRGQGWRLVHPHEVANSPSTYQQYIGRSRAELCCPKPIYRELKTGWLSDRTACYLASGRPVLAEETGFSDHFPTGKGLLAFSNLADAIAGVREIDANYAQHSRAARQFAEEFLDSRKCLRKMLDLCAAAKWPSI